MTSRLGMRTVTIASIALAVIVGLAGCGTVPETGAVSAASLQRSAGPPAGSRAEATLAARRLLAALVLPAGARRLPQQPLPPGLRQPGEVVGAFPQVDLYGLYRLPMTMGTGDAFLGSHLPRGLAWDGNGQGGPAGGAPAELFLSAEQKRLPSGIYSIELVDAIVAGPAGSSVLRADAEVTWYPPRSSAEQLIASHFRAVRIWPGSGRAVTVGSRPDVASMVTLLNSLQAAPQVAVHCPVGLATFVVTLEPAVTSQPRVVVTADGCLTDAVTIGGRGQPALWDSGNELSHLAASLLPLRPAEPGQVESRPHLRCLCPMTGPSADPSYHSPVGLSRCPRLVCEAAGGRALGSG
jgi:hypothetical protein